VIFPQGLLPTGPGTERTSEKVIEAEWVCIGDVGHFAQKQSRAWRSIPGEGNLRVYHHGAVEGDLMGPRGRVQGLADLQIRHSEDAPCVLWSQFPKGSSQTNAERGEIPESGEDGHGGVDFQSTSVVVLGLQKLGRIPHYGKHLALQKL